MSAPRPPASRPATLVAAATVTAVEGVVALGYGLLLVLGGLFARVSSVVNAEGVGVLFGLFGVGLLLVARGLWRGRGWARSPAVVAQLLAAPIAYASVTAGQYPVGVPLGLAALTGLIALFAPGTRRGLDR